MNEVSLAKLLHMPPYSLNNADKNKILLAIIKKQLKHIQLNKYLKNFFSRQSININKINSLINIPFMPVQMFKFFNLSTCPQKQIVRILKSSGTTSSMPSKIPLNKNTIINQTKALKSILADYLGEKRKIFLVIDNEEINNPSDQISARTAGVRGLSIYAKKFFYLLKKTANNSLVINWPVIYELQNYYKNEEVYVFGFTYIIWKVFCEQLKNKDLKLYFKKINIFHSGGWKKLEQKKVSKKYFSLTLAKIFSTSVEAVHDFYGMAEQTGIIFVDCKYGYKHIPNFAQIIIRDLQTLQPCGFKKAGIIEVLSVLADSYYAQAILTEDKGYLAGIDDCRCGRKGPYFKFLSRIKQVELRGCGDTFRE